MQHDSPKELRQKAINLIYLILLALLFSFIPSDFIDSVHQSDESINLLCNEIERLNAENKILLLKSLREQDEDLFELTKQRLLELDQETQNTIDSVRNIKLSLINVDKFNEFGYLVNGKRENVSNEVMIEGKKASALVNILRNFKEEATNFLSEDKTAVLDSILPLPQLFRHSDGDFAEIEDFYFHKNPLNISVLNLSHFESRVQDIRSYIIENTFDELIEIKKSDLPPEISHLVETSEQAIGNASYLTEFYEEIKLEENVQDESVNDYLSLESLSDSVYAAGQPFRFNIHFDTAATKFVRAQVKDVKSGDVQSFSFTQPGPFMYVPPQKGYYEIKLSSEHRSTSKFIKVIDLEPVLQNEKISTLYVGIDNALNIKTSEFEDTEELIARITEGEILKKGKNFYARVTKPGMVQVEIYAKMPYGMVRVAEKTFAVRDLILPLASVNKHRSGQTVELAELKSFRKLDVTSEEYLVDEQYFVSDFEFTVIYNQHTAILQPIKNTGASLNSTTIDALSKVKKGDILIFDRINAKSSLGTEVKPAPLHLTIN